MNTINWLWPSYWSAQLINKKDESKDESPRLINKNESKDKFGKNESKDKFGKNESKDKFGKDESKDESSRLINKKAEFDNHSSVPNNINAYTYTPWADSLVNSFSQDDSPLNEEAMDYLHREIDGVRNLLSDFSLLVSAQDPIFDNIENHVDTSTVKVTEGQSQLKQANKKQKRYKKWLVAISGGLSLAALGLGLGLGLRTN